MKIVTAPNAVLSQTAKPVLKIDSSVKKLIEEMKQTLYLTKDPDGVGLAAPQVGKSLRIFIAKPNKKAKTQIFINPEIVTNDKSKYLELERRELTKFSQDDRQLLGPRKFSLATEAPAIPRAVREAGTKLEGCLSLPTIWGTVKRFNNLTLKFFDQQGMLRQQTFSGLPAIIIQHEIDHLNGILFPKRVLEQKGKFYKSKKNEKGEDIFQELEL